MPGTPTAILHKIYFITTYTKLAYCILLRTVCKYKQTVFSKLEKFDKKTSKPGFTEEDKDNITLLQIS